MKNAAVIYCRVSTEEQVEKSSLDIQRRECEAKARELGCEVLKVFRDEGASGIIQDRPAMNALMEYCIKHQAKVKYIIVKNVDRFARDNLVYQTLKRLLQALGIQLSFVNQPGIGDKTPTSDFLENIFSSVAQLEHATILERTHKGSMEVVAKGGWTAIAPYGYRNARTADGISTLSVEGKEAKVIQKIFELFGGGTPLMEVAKTLNTLGYKSARGNDWSFQSVDNIVRNPVYIGRIKNRNFPDKTIEGLHTGIITLDLWERVQKRFAGKIPVKKQRFNPKFPLTTILHCPICHGPMTGSDSTGKAKKKYSYYHCRKNGCKSPSFNREKVEQNFKDALKHISPTSKGVEILEREIRGVWYEKWQQHVEDRTTLRARFTTLEQKRDQIEEKYILNSITEDTYQRQLHKVGEEIVQVNEKLNELMISEDRIKELLAFLRKFLTSISNTWENSIPEHKRLVQRYVFPAGIQFETDGSFRTLILPPVLALSAGKVAADSNVAAPRGVEPRFSG